MQVTGGSVLQKNCDVFTSYEIDSRKAKPGSLFFALRGTVTDGHLYVADAAGRGAGGTIVEQMVDAPLSLTVIQVPHSLQALRELAASVRNASNARFIGITGSAGKTSTKEFTAALLSRKFRIYKSEGNLNSITGLPLSLLAMEDPECAVFEVGMSEPGEIAGLTALLQPHVRVLLNVNPVHLQQFPSVDAIADEKSALLNGVRETDIVVYNADDARLTKRVTPKKAHKISYGFADDADLRIADVQSKGVHGQTAWLEWRKDRHPIRTTLCGKGNLYNVAAAAATGLACSLEWQDILRGIESFRPYAQRGTLIPAAGFDIYDDTYNSNPAALRFALELTSQSEGYSRKVAILGDMLELGPQENEFHQEAGRQAASLGIDVLVAAGSRSRGMAEAARKSGVGEVYEAPDSQEAAAVASSIARFGDLVLVKGSRGMKMEFVVEALRKK